MSVLSVMSVLSDLSIYGAGSAAGDEVDGGVPEAGLVDGDVALGAQDDDVVHGAGDGDGEQGVAFGVLGDRVKLGEDDDFGFEAFGGADGGEGDFVGVEAVVEPAEAVLRPTAASPRSSGVTSSPPPPALTGGHGRATYTRGPGQLHARHT
ncbi:MAG: hypothetical protein OJF49_003243 [Ktedonobacterales bacterium]|nr:MAG: hypothetical protein OJF49_003243 [Ktedonobacterales bacterium]